MSTFQFKLLVLVFLATITFNLFRGLYFLVTGKGGGKNTARSLSWRIGLSVLLFFILIVLKLTGKVEPHALNEAPKATVETPGNPEDEGKSLQDIQNENDSSGGRVRLKQE